MTHDSVTRHSVDSVRFARNRTSVKRIIERQPATPEESFEDVKLDDTATQPKKRGFFAKLTDTHDKDGSTQGVGRFLSSRKRAPNAQESEMGQLELPPPAGDSTGSR